MEELRAKVTRAALPEEARVEAEKQVRRLDQMHAESAEAGVLRTYVEWLTELPWSVSSEETIDLEVARKILDEDHYDLEQVKDRILDYLAVRKLRGGAHGPILCFLGPPGVGKTSLGRSIARALGRKFVRISLGGIRDEAEIRGHRRTYVGAMPGRLIQALKQAGTNNPVLLLDEVDKVGADNRGDPSAALLEVLDPEQNHTFRDHYLGVSFDLSKVVFIATANQPETIPPPLRDRMETIRLSGYAEEEKLVIAERYIIPKQITEAGLTANEIVISREVTRRIVSEYTRESGLRELERLIAHLARKIARRVVEEASRASANGATGVLNPRAPTIGIEEVPTFLGAPRYLPEERHRVAEIGTVNGLAWTPYGGEVLLIEAQTMAGKGSLILTGQLGDVMKESAQAALSFARAHALALGLASEFYAGREIHIHVPAGGVPKDGPSAGVTMACALVSLISGIAGAARGGDDRRAHPARQGAADRRAEREAAGRGARRDHHRDHPGRQRLRPDRDPQLHHRQAVGAAGAHDARGAGDRARASAHPSGGQEGDRRSCGRRDDQGRARARAAQGHAPSWNGLSALRRLLPARAFILLPGHGQVRPGRRAGAEATVTSLRDVREAVAIHALRLLASV